MKYILLLMAFSASNVYGQYNLSLHLKKGESYFLDIHSSNHFTGMTNGHPVSATSSMNGVMKFKVLQAGTETYELEASYDTLDISMKSPMGNIQFSTGSSDANQGMAGGGMGPMSGRAFHITILKNGAIRKMETPDTSGFSSMMKNFPMVQALRQLFMMGPVRQSFSKEMMQAQLEKLTALFPNKNVALNESWGAVITPDSSSDRMVKNTYKLVSYEGGIATIKGHSEMITKSGKQKSMGFGMMMFPLVYEISGNTESTIQINTSTGWIKQAEIKSGLKGFVQMKKGEEKDVNKEPLEMEGMATISGK